MDQNATHHVVSPVSAAKKHGGGCHCGAVRFEVVIDGSKGTRCNCSICTKVASVGNLVKPAAFKLVSGAENLSVYVWGGKVGRRYFCKHCGIHCYGEGHLAMLGGDFVSINMNSLDDFDPRDVKLAHWDGRHDNWHAGTSDKPWPIARAAAS